MGVSALGDGRETGQMSIEGEPEFFAGRMAERQETCLGAARLPAIGRDELHRALEFGFRNCRILGANLLIRPIVDAVAGQLFPIARPIGAEPAIAVIDEQWPSCGWGRFGGIDGLGFGWLVHDINGGWRSLT